VWAGAQSLQYVVSSISCARTKLGEEDRERERRLLLSWAKAGKDSKESREATRRERDVWCLLFVLIRQGLKGGSGP
jgi:hypothetical protein